MGKIIDPALCVKCKGKNLCGKPCYFVEILKLGKKSLKIRERDEFCSPPSVFIGRFGYPHVSVGALCVKDFSFPHYYDDPKLWFKERLSVANVLSKRLSMVNPAFKSHVKMNDGVLETVREIAMAKKSTLLEVEFKKRPRIKIEFSHVFSPVGMRGLVKKLALEENPRVDRRIEKAYYDTDLKASEAVTELYRRGVNENAISRVLSAGMLGRESQRKLVPTRWSITAVDDMLGKYMIEEIRYHKPVDSIRIHYAEYNGNRFWVLLLPSTWKFELVEIAHPIAEWKRFGRRYYITKDYEDFTSRRSYVEETAGGYYASRLGVLEHLKKLEMQAAALVVREILPNYWAPLGVWLVRETVREAMRRPPVIFSSLENAVGFVESQMKANVSLRAVSTLLKKVTEKQTSILMWRNKK